MLIGIFGTGRNGSTLITRLLDGISGTFILPVDINFISILNDLADPGYVARSTVLNASTQPLNHLREHISAEKLIKWYSRYIKDIEKTYITQIEDDFSLGQDPTELIVGKTHYLPSEFVHSFLNATASWLNNNYPVEHFFFKTSETPYINDYEQMFPDMKFIHIIRDPVNVCASQKRTLMCNKSLPSWYLGKDYIETMIDKRWIPHVRTIIEKDSDKRHYTVRYEDITQNPLETITGICSWLKIPLPDEPTKQTVLGGRFMKQLPSNTSKKGVDTPVEVVHNLSNFLNYNEILTERERDFIISKTYDLARKFSYLENTGKPDKWSLLIKWILPDKWEFMHSNSARDVLKTLSSLFYRRYYITRNLFSSNGGKA